MTTVGLIVLVLFLVLGFFSLFLGLPGTWIILAAAGLYGWATSFQKITLPVVIVLASAALLAEALEYLLAAAGARRFGASRKGALASIAGGLFGALLGAPLFFGLGALIGLFVGAFVGVFLYEWLKNRNVRKSLRSGLGGFLGRISGTMIKILLALGMITIVLWSLF